MSMYEIEKTVREYLESKELHFQHVEDMHSFLMGIELDCSEMNRCAMSIVAHDEEDLSCHVTYETNVPEYARGRVVEYLTRANYGLFLGSFQMDMNDGQIIYQIGAAYSDHNVTDDELGRMISVASGMAERYAEGLHDVICGNLSPEQAVARAEGDDDPFDLPDDDDELPFDGHISFDEELQRALAEVEEEFADEDEDDEDDDDESEWKAVLKEMTADQLETLSDAIFAEMGKVTGLKPDNAGDIPEEYAEMVASLDPLDLTKIALAVLEERFARDHGIPVKKRRTPSSAAPIIDSETVDDPAEMTSEELSRRKASADLKAKLREKMFDDREAC
ncbi:MAG: YbjN domain-containing protein [Oscillospiraceae bacterium]|nr:YbjN domain-containing protein [Oscillospiraceae bacterium]